MFDAGDSGRKQPKRVNEGEEVSQAGRCALVSQLANMPAHAPRLDTDRKCCSLLREREFLIRPSRFLCDLVSWMISGREAVTTAGQVCVVCSRGLVESSKPVCVCSEDYNLKNRLKPSSCLRSRSPTFWKTASDLRASRGHVSSASPCCCCCCLPRSFSLSLCFDKTFQTQVNFLGKCYWAWEETQLPLPNQHRLLHSPPLLGK